MEPLPKYLDAIRGFPTPVNTRDIQSWFGLVNQVSHYAQLREMMDPFRKFLSPKEKFVWDDQLDALFEQSKAKIIEAIKEGVQIFDVTKRTCLRTDWSKQGIGYLLAQKHCNCEARSYGCCEDGWKIALAGSRFLSPAEKNYAPVEGEALAVAWALEQTRFFTMGCSDLLVIVDHKPLTKIFGDRRLDEIDNPRLFRLKRRTLMWSFDIEYQRGTRNAFADAMSRYPSKYADSASCSMMSNDDISEASIVGNIGSEAEAFFAVTWERVKLASEEDESLCDLKKLITTGFPAARKDLPENLRPFWDVKDHLYASEGVVLYKDRIVIPFSLRHHVVENLHSAHQGASTMFSRAQGLVYWPGMIADIEDARNQCRTCHTNAPSQSRLPPTAPKLPTTPFQMIYADYFQLKGKHYLIIGDRLSGWTEVVKADPGSSSSGAKGLCEALRRIFVTFGVAEEISTDGGMEFVSAEARDFYSRWGISHRLSSAYFPQSNGRAEVAVKMTKRVLEDNVGANGILNTDNVVRALLQQRNTPDKECKLSPAQVLFGRSLRDAMPQLDKSVMIFESDQIHNQWHQAWSAKEEAIRTRLVRSCEDLEEGSKELPALREGDSVFIQNQDKSSGRPNKWDRQGKIVAAKNNDQYLVKVDGTGRLTLRNRRFLKKYQPRLDMTRDVPHAMPQHTAQESTPQSAAQTVPQHIVPPAVPQDAAQTIQQIAPHAKLQHADAAQTGPQQHAPQAVPPQASQPVPQHAPQPVPQYAPQPVPQQHASQQVPQHAPLAAPQHAPQLVPQHAPQHASHPASGRQRGASQKTLRNQQLLRNLTAREVPEEERQDSRSSRRDRNQRMVYDASTGLFGKPISK